MQLLVVTLDVILMEVDKKGGRIKCFYNVRDNGSTARTQQGFNHFGYGIPEMVHSLYDYLLVQ